MRAISIGFDKELFSDQGDSRLRMAEYGRMLERLDIVVFTKRGFKTKIISDRVSVHPTNSISKIFFIRDAIKIGRRLVKENGADLVIAQDAVLSGWPAYRLARRGQLKLLVGIFGTNIFDPLWLKESVKHRLFKYIGEKVMRSADAIQTDGYETYDELRARYDDKVFWKPIVPSNIERFQVKKKFSTQGAKILFVGRLVAQKNIPFLLEVIEGVTKQPAGREVKFTIIGDGPRRECLNREILKRGLKEHIEWIPKVERADIVSYYQSNDILILTSYYEGLAKVFMEAAAIGLPIVTTAVSGVKNIISDGESGYVIKQNDRLDFVNKLIKLISDHELRTKFSERIKNDFWAKYNFQITLDIQKKIFDYLEKRY